MSNKKMKDKPLDMGKQPIKKPVPDGFIFPPTPVSKMEHQEKLDHKKKKDMDKLKKKYTDVIASYNLPGNEDKGMSFNNYDVNERLMLSALAHLTINQTLMELVKRVPDPLPPDEVCPVFDHAEINPKTQEPSARPKANPELKKNPNLPLKMYLERQPWPKFPKSYAVTPFCLKPSLSPYNEPSNGLVNPRPDVPSKLKVKAKSCLCDATEEDKKKKKKKKGKRGSSERDEDEDEDEDEGEKPKPKKKKKAKKPPNKYNCPGQPPKKPPPGAGNKGDKQAAKKGPQKQKSKPKATKRDSPDFKHEVSDNGDPDDAELKIHSQGKNKEEEEYQITGVTKTDEGEMFIISGVDKRRPTKKMLDSSSIYNRRPLFSAAGLGLREMSRINEHLPATSSEMLRTDICKTPDCNCLAKLEEIKEYLNRSQREASNDLINNPQYNQKASSQQIVYFHPPVKNNPNNRAYNAIDNPFGFIKLSVDEALNLDFDKGFGYDVWRDLNDGTGIDPIYLTPAVYTASTQPQSGKPKKSTKLEGSFAVNPNFDPEELDDEKKDKRDSVKLSRHEKDQTELLKSLFGEMAGDEFPLCQLPDAHAIPYFKYWMKVHCGFRMTAQERKRILDEGEKVLKSLCEYKPMVPQFSDEGVIPCHMSETFDWHNHLMKSARKARENYYHILKRSLIDDARLYWTFFDNVLTPMKDFHHTYFAYMPPRELDIIAYRPWQEGEAKGK